MEIWELVLLLVLPPLEHLQQFFGMMPHEAGPAASPMAPAPESTSIAEPNPGPPATVSESPQPLARPALPVVAVAPRSAESNSC